jgi:hypothetical protein
MELVDSVFGMHLPDVHESEAADVGRVGVSAQAHELLTGEAQREQFVEQTEGAGYDAARSHASHLHTATARLLQMHTHG